MGQETFSIKDIKFDLKKPCKDCPFLKTTPYHEGIADDLPNLWVSIEAGKAMHSCHKTDPRSDSPEGQRYKGPLQHCAGLLTMMSNDVRLMCNPQRAAFHSGKWTGEMDHSAPVYSSFREMLKFYYDEAKKRLKPKRGKNAAKQ